MKNRLLIIFVLMALVLSTACTKPPEESPTLEPGNVSEEVSDEESSEIISGQESESESVDMSEPDASSSQPDEPTVTVTNGPTDMPTPKPTATIAPATPTPPAGPTLKFLEPLPYRLVQGEWAYGTKAVYETDELGEYLAKFEIVKSKPNGEQETVIFTGWYENEEEIAYSFYDHFAIYGDYLYCMETKYSGHPGIFNFVEILRINLKSPAQSEKVVSFYHAYHGNAIWRIDDALYFSGAALLNGQNPPVLGFYKLELSDHKITKLNDKQHIVGIDQNEKYIYYFKDTGLAGTTGYYTSKFDGTEEKIAFASSPGEDYQKDGIAFYRIESGWIYYGHEFNMYKCKTDGTGHEELELKYKE